MYWDISAIVLISVVGMAAANDLQKWMDKKFKSQPEVQSQFEINKIYGIQRLPFCIAYQIH